MSQLAKRDYTKGWKLYYHQNINGRSMGGRGAPIRVMFELAGVEWEEANKDKQSLENSKDILGCKSKMYPNFALPTVTHGDDLSLSQSTNILLFLGEVFGIQPKDPYHRALANQVSLTVYDVLVECYQKRREVNYGELDKMKDEDKEKAVKALNGFLDTRFASYLELIQEQLSRNNKGKGWFFEDSVSVADVQVADLMRRYELGSPEHYNETKKFDLLKEHQKRFENIDAIKKYSASSRYPKPFGWLG